MNKRLMMFITFCVVLITSIIMLFGSKPASYEITDKYEFNGHYYVNVQIEISENDYIGYDIGDEYSFKK